MYYKPKHFTIKELIDRKTYGIFGENAFMLFSPNALMMVDGVREFLGVSIVINDWGSGGNYQFSGFRARSVEIGAEYSQHRLGCAFDLKPKGLSIQEAFNRIMSNKDDEKLKLITCIEDIQYTPTWLHVDCRNISDRIRIVKP